MTQLVLPSITVKCAFRKRGFRSTLRLVPAPGEFAIKRRSRRTKALRWLVREPPDPVRLFAVSSMPVCYALEKRSTWFILGSSVACALWRAPGRP
jgi:hypothetical protein